MTTENGVYLFGFWDKAYGEPTDKYEDYHKYKNGIEKKKIIQHMESLGKWFAGSMVTDIFTGEKFNAGIIKDGPFTFSVDFLRYYKTKDIGIPYEYEEYLNKILN